MRMQCGNCRSELHVVEERNKLSEEDQKRCIDAIAGIQKSIRQFDTYVVPTNFFGPGRVSAY